MKFCRLVQIKTILANSTFNINEIVGKTASDGDDVDDDDANDGDDDDDDDECIGTDDLFEFSEDHDSKNLYAFRHSISHFRLISIIFNSSEFAIKEEDGRISLAYERLPGIPKNIADKFALRTHTLDLSYNTIRLTDCQLLDFYLTLS